MTCVLLTLGRLPKALAIARALAGAGGRVIVAEPFRRHLTGASRRIAASFQTPSPSETLDGYLQRLLEIVREQRVDLVVPVSEEILFAAELTGRLPAQTRLFAMPQARIAALHDKRRFNAAARAHGLAAPATFDAGAPEAAAFGAARDMIAKPIYGCAGRGLQILPSGAALPSNPDLLLQERIDGRPVSAMAVAHDGRVIGLSAYRPILEAGTVAIAFETEREANAAVRDWVAAFVGAERLSGFVSFDFIVDRSGRPFAIECNPRATSGVHFFDPAGLAQAILNPESAEAIAPHAIERWQQFYPCLTEAWAAIGRPAQRRRALDALRRARDVTWDPADPSPFVTMPFTAAQIIWRSIRRGESFGEASTYDLEWRPEPS